MASTALMVLATVALGGTSAAADTKGTVAIVNGIPGQRIDICLGGSEISSGTPYGRAVLRNVVTTGPKTLRVFKAGTGKCRGQKLAQKAFSVAPGADLTFVATKQSPGKIVMFDNAAPVFFGQIPATGTPYAYSFIIWRYAASHPVEFRYQYFPPGSTLNPVDPAAIWTKGDEVSLTSGSDVIWQLSAMRPGTFEVLTRRAVFIVASRRYEWILVGTNVKNLRFVVLDREVSMPD